MGMIINKSVAIFIGAILTFALEGAEGEEGRSTEGINEQLLQAVISIERGVEQANEGPVKLLPLGTGFLVGVDDKISAIVTAKHVVTNEAGRVVSNLYFRLNPKNANSAPLPDQEVARLGMGTWFLAATNVDLALRLIKLDFPKFEHRRFPRSFILPSDKVRAGAFVYLLGYPMGLYSAERAMPILRWGVVARSSEGDLLIDGNSFPGHSGGPIVYRPAVKFSQKGDVLISMGTLQDEQLIGVVSQQVTYKDTAFSQQTKRPRITFEEDSGLTIAVPADEIAKLLERDDVRAQVAAIKSIR